eukprot:scaffold886_cov317-Prasinococcus_capsulatus_cf.AAC.14
MALRWRHYLNLEYLPPLVAVTLRRYRLSRPRPNTIVATGGRQAPATRTDKQLAPGQHQPVSCLVAYQVLSAAAACAVGCTSRKPKSAAAAKVLERWSKRAWTPEPPGCWCRCYSGRREGVRR